MKKNILTSTLLIVTVSLIWSCNVLDHTPELNITDDQAFVNRNSAVSALNGAYNSLQGNSYYGRDYNAFGYLPADNVQWSGSFNYYQQFDANSLTADNQTISSTWGAIYTAINSANNIIAEVQQVEDHLFTEEDRNRIQGEAYFIRALAYFDLARAWGGVPLKLTPTRSPEDGVGLGRSSLAETYRQVLSDLIEAEALLPDAVDRNRATRHTVYALRARLHLYLEEWEQAGIYAGELIEHPSYTLAGSYPEFVENKNTSESILELAYSNSNRNGHNGYFLPSSHGGRLEWRPTDEFVAVVTDEEIGGNRSVLVATSGDVVYGNLYHRSSNGDDPAYILRLAELYLIRAEARAQQGDIDGSQEDLNAVRNRAGLDDTEAGTAEGLLLAIEEERRIEFAFEAHRWFDLVRTGRAGEVLGVTDQRKWVFPLPLGDIDTDPDLDQNDGYD